MTTKQFRSTGKGADTGDDVVRSRLERMTKEALVEFVISLIEGRPEIGRAIEEKAAIERGDLDPVVESIRAEIEELTLEKPFRDDWRGECDIPDYSGVRDRLERLLEAGHADAVVELGEELWRRGNRQLEEAQDEGETGDEIDSCMDVVLQAIVQSSASMSDRILEIIDISRSDEFNVLKGVEPHLAALNDRAGWAGAADVLVARLDEMPSSDKTGVSWGDYRRRGLLDWAIKALERAEREAEIIPLLERAARKTDCSDALVDRLISAGRNTEAKAAAAEGFVRTISGAPGIAWGLLARLRNIAEIEENFPLATTYRVLDFLHRPELESYKALEAAAKRAGRWPAVREAALQFLETGKSQWFVAGADGAWSLPDPEVTIPAMKVFRDEFPANATLIRIALHEKDPDTALKWYESMKERSRYDYYLDEELALKVSESHPDASLRIWQSLAERQIEMVKPAAYQVAARYLRQMRRIYQENRRMDEWIALIKKIRVEHKKKRILMQTLSVLEAEKTPSA